jgi:hypothetical protein
VWSSSFVIMCYPLCRLRRFRGWSFSARRLRLEKLTFSW